MSEEFNYCVGHYWDSDSEELSVYAYGSEVHFGTIDDAKKFLKYVQAQDSTKTYKIFKVVELQ